MAKDKKNEAMEAEKIEEAKKIEQTTETAAEPINTSAEPTFGKRQVITSKKFKMYRDYLTARLDDKPYTIAEIEQILQEVK